MYVYIIPKNKTKKTLKFNTKRSASNNFVVDGKITESPNGSVQVTLSLVGEATREISARDYLILKIRGKFKSFLIVDVERDILSDEAELFCESGSVSLLYDSAPKYSATEEKTLQEYLKLFISDKSINIVDNSMNSLEPLKKKLTYENSESLTARLLDLANEFNVKFSYGYNFSNVRKTGLTLYIEELDSNVKKRIKLNSKEIKVFRKTESIRNFYSAIETAENSINLSGVAYDDGNFFVNNTALCSRELLKQSESSNFIYKVSNFNSKDKKDLLDKCIDELTKVAEIAKYEVDFYQNEDFALEIDNVYEFVGKSGEIFTARVEKVEFSISGGMTSVELTQI